MTAAPDVPLRLEFAVEVPGTPEQVWHAIATAEGITAWFLPTDLEEREGGAICTHMGDDVSSPGTVTGWDPPRRFAYVEPEWADLVGRDRASVTPLVTEFLIEAESEGTCVVRVVSSAFGTGADWEREFFADMERTWKPFFDNLRIYLAHFPGQRATVLEASADVPGSAEDAWSTLRQALGLAGVDQPVEIRGLEGEVQRIGHHEALMRLDAPVPGFVGFFAFDKGDGAATAGIRGYLFSEDAPDFVRREQPGWKSWLDESLAVPAG